ncbi:MAG: transglutaminase-like domain-containing protein [Candidatus Micrarchaeota archaeon]
MKKSLAVLAVIFLFLLPCVYPQSADITDPVLTSSVNSIVTKSGTVRAIGGSFVFVELNISAPQKTNWQLPVYHGSTVKDSEGNTLFSIKENSPKNPLTYSFPTEVLTKARMTDSLPNNYSVPENLKKYLLPSQGIESDDIAIAKFARSITENSTSDFERAAKLAIWVHENLEYDESMTGKEESATWVLSNRRGVCAEFTTLFIALARAAEIPARYVSGYSYANSKGWLGHAWAEVYLGEWVPIDPTWMEAGHLDATHIQMSAQTSGKSESYAFAYLTPGARLDWSGSGTLGSKIREVEVKDVQKMPAESGYSLIAATQKISFGGETVVYAKISSKDYRVIDLELASCSGDSSLSVDEPKRFEILSPGEEKVIVWKVKAPTSLNPNYYYTCPLVLNSAYLAGKKANIEMRENEREAVFDAWLEKSSLSLGEGQKLLFSATNFPAGAKLSVVAGDKLYSFTASKTTQEVSFVPSSPGEQTAWVFSNFGGVKKLTYSVLAQPSMLSFGKLILPGRIAEGGELAISVPVASSTANPLKVKVTAIYDGEELSSYATFYGTKTFNFTFENLKAGEGVLTVRAESEGINTERKVMVDVASKPFVTIQTSYSNGGNLTNVTFVASKTGDARRILIYIDGEIAPLSGGSGTISLSPGTRQMKVVWQDAYGQEFSFEKELYVPKKGTIFETSTTSICPSFLIIPLLFVFASAKGLNNTKNTN